MQSEEFQKRNETNEIYIPVGQRLGDKVIEFKNVTKGYGDRVLIDNLSFKMPKGAIVGVIGGNGAGKSTLFRMMMGKEKPDSGEIEVGRTVQLACVDQSREDLDGRKTVFQQISDGFDQIRSATTRSRRAPTSVASTSRAAISRSSSRTCPVVSAVACTWP